MTRRIAPLYDSLQREMTALWSRYDDDELALILDFLTASCDLAVTEIAKLQRKDAAPKRRAMVRRTGRPGRIGRAA